MAEYVSRSSNAMVPLSHAREGSHVSDDDDDGGSKTHASGDTPPPAHLPLVSTSSSSAGKKPRGRPPGSKNKPKPPVVITRDSESAMQPVVFELAAGADVIGSISAFALRRRVGISVLSGAGAVANVALRHPTSPASTITLHGRFDILSISGSFLPSPASSSPFTVSLAGAQGQVIGGTVAGPLTAATAMVVVAASFLKPEFYRLPPVEEDDTDAKEEEEIKPAAAVEPVQVYGGVIPFTSGQVTPHHERVLWAQPSSSRPPSHHY
ncbi:AT-hook motif nuclear-localized protein 28-like [Typha latifolia]|uniref:AT-hook motif nuclear-localized protein 28-like n=1 Tax=Typha latifolia TaxID=4733 RepID=UPI003C2FA2D2